MVLCLVSGAWSAASFRKLPFEAKDLLVSLRTPRRNPVGLRPSKVRDAGLEDPGLPSKPPFTPLESEARLLISLDLSFPLHTITGAWARWFNNILTAGTHGAFAVGLPSTELSPCVIILFSSTKV